MLSLGISALEVIPGGQLSYFIAPGHRGAYKELTFSQAKVTGHTLCSIEILLNMKET